MWAEFAWRSPDTFTGVIFELGRWTIYLPTKSIEQSAKAALIVTLMPSDVQV